MDWGDKRYNQVQKYEDEYLKIIEKVFNVSIERISSNSSPFENTSSNITVRFPEDNYRLIKTDYYLNNTNRLLHFTGLKILFSIINEQAIRLYNLNNSNDSEEYTYASENLSLLYEIQGWTKDDIEKYFNRIKDNAFILSTTDIKEYNNTDFWESSYGEYGKGVAIELEIINDPINWKNFFLSTIKYGKIEIIKELLENLKNHQIKNLNNRYDIRLNQFFGLHKSPEEKWIKEKEIRIITFTPEYFFKKEYNKQVYNDIKIKNDTYNQVRYFQLPLYGSNNPKINKYFWDRVPVLKISKIYFGPKLSFKNIDIYEFIYKLRYYIADKLGYLLAVTDIQKL